MAEVLGSDFISGEDMLTVSKSKLKEIEKKVESILPPAGCKILVAELRRLRYRPFDSLIESYQDYVRKLAERNQKNIYPVEVEAETVLVDPDRYNDFVQKFGARFALREGKPISLLMLDIDFFKKLNDTLGHPAGDECIKKVARLISGNLKRSSDIVARYGGEEFSVILPGTDGIGALYIAECIKNSIEGEQLGHPDSSVSKYVTVSIGVACTVPTSETDIKDLIGAADEQLYSAKQQGRNRVAYNFDEDWGSQKV